MKKWWLIVGLSLFGFQIFAACESCPDISSVTNQAVNWPETESVTTLVEQVNFVETCVPKPAFQTPVPDSILTGTNIVFSWENCTLAINDYQLLVGSSFGGDDLYNSGSLGTNLNHQVTGLPQQGETIYVRLNYEVGGDVKWIDARYTANNSSCLLDSDNDRLPDCVETNTGVFVSATDTGTDPNNPDTDGDGIDDGDEVLGTTAGLNLPAMGTNPLQENILLEYDWFDDNLDPGTCGAHSHRPTPEIAERVRQAFANAPRMNPDGTTGIYLIQDYGQGGAFTGGNLVPDANGVISGTVSGSEFQTIKSNHFADNRRGYFHYTLFPHRYNTSSSSSGVAELPGDDLVVSLYCFGSTSNVANTIMHELGHNLNLRHGGNENCNWKRNYNSVMNYRHQFPGVDTNCDTNGDGVLDYSSGTNIVLNETNLDENEGVCGDVAVDWNGNSIIETGVSFNVNPQGDPTCGVLTVLRDHNDWANIFFGGLETLFLSSEESDCTNEPPMIVPANQRLDR